MSDRPEVVTEMATGEKDSTSSGAEYLTIAEAAEVLGVQTRSVYYYLEDSSLTGVRVGRATMLKKDEVLCFRRTAPGRTRVNVPPWHVPPTQNMPYLTTITVRMRAGQEAKLEHRLHAMRDARTHWLPGTTARYIARDQQQPEVVQIVFIWRGATMPPEEEQQEALIAFQADLADVLEWETASWQHACVLLHA